MKRLPPGLSPNPLLWRTTLNRFFSWSWLILLVSKYCKNLTGRFQYLNSCQYSFAFFHKFQNEGCRLWWRVEIAWYFWSSQHWSTRTVGQSVSKNSLCVWRPVATYTSDVRSSCNIMAENMTSAAHLQDWKCWWWWGGSMCFFVSFGASRRPIADKLSMSHILAMCFHDTVSPLIDWSWLCKSFRRLLTGWGYRTLLCIPCLCAKSQVYRQLRPAHWLWLDCTIPGRTQSPSLLIRHLQASRANLALEASSRSNCAHSCRRRIHWVVCNP